MGSAACLDMIFCNPFFFLSAFASFILSTPQCQSRCHVWRATTGNNNTRKTCNDNSIAHHGYSTTSDNTGVLTVLWNGDGKLHCFFFFFDSSWCSSRDDRTQHGHNGEVQHRDTIRRGQRCSSSNRTTVDRSCHKTESFHISTHITLHHRQSLARVTQYYRVDPS